MEHSIREETPVVAAGSGLGGRGANPVGGIRHEQGRRGGGIRVSAGERYNRSQAVGGSPPSRPTKRCRDCAGPVPLQKPQAQREAGFRAS